MPLKLVTPPDDEPVSLLEAKQHLRVRDGETSQDSLIQALISAARQHAEMVTQRAFCTQAWQLVLDAFPGGSGLLGVPYGEPYTTPEWAILLQKSPVQSVTSIVYTDFAGATQTMNAATDYITELVGEPARITPPFGKIWPIPVPQIGAVRVNFVAGYGQPSDVPECIKRWMLLRVGSMFENREEVIVGTRIVVADMPFVDRLLDPVTVPKV